MANTLIADPIVSLSQPRENNPQASRRQVMPWEYDERRLEQDLDGIELDPQKAKPIPMASKGFITGFSVAGAAEASLDWMTKTAQAAPGILRETLNFFGGIASGNMESFTNSPQAQSPNEEAIRRPVPDTSGQPLPDQEKIIRLEQFFRDKQKSLPALPKNQVMT